MRWLATGLFLMINLIAYFMLSGLLPAVLLIFPVMALSFVAALAHEAGHALAAVMLGRRVLAFVAVPFAMTFRPPRLHVMRTMPAEVGGFVLYEEHPEGDSRRETILIAAAGPAANLLLALVALSGIIGVSAATQPIWRDGQALTLVAGPVPTNEMVAELPSEAELAPMLAQAEADFRWRRRLESTGLLLGALFWLSLGLGIANLIPFDRSDGAAIRDALRRGYA